MSLSKRNDAPHAVSEVSQGHGVSIGLRWKSLLIRCAVGKRRRTQRENRQSQGGQQPPRVGEASQANVDAGRFPASNDNVRPGRDETRQDLLLCRFHPGNVMYKVRQLPVGNIPDATLTSSLSRPEVGVLRPARLRARLPGKEGA